MQFKTILLFCSIAISLQARFTFIKTSLRNISLHKRNMSYEQSKKLHKAVMKNDHSLISTLLSDGICANQSDNSVGYGALHRAVALGHTKVVEEFLKAGASIAVVDTNGQTPLHYILHAKQPELLPILVQAGADVNAQDRFQETLLHKCIKLGLVDMVRALLDHGADVLLVNDQGYDALRYAEYVARNWKEHSISDWDHKFKKEKDHETIIEILKKAI